MPLTDTQQAFAARYLGGAPSPDTGTAVNLVALQKMRLDWDAARKQAGRDLQKLEKTIISTFAEEPELVQVAEIARGMAGSLERLDTGLLDALDNALSAESDSDRSKHNAQAGRLTKQYIGVLESDPVLKLVEDNPFVPVKITTPMRDALNALRSELG